MASFVKTDVAFFFSNNEACCTFMCATPRCMSCRTNIVMSVLNTRNSYSYFWTKSLKHNVKCKSPVHCSEFTTHLWKRKQKRWRKQGSRNSGNEFVKTHSLSADDPTVYFRWRLEKVLSSAQISFWSGKGVAVLQTKNKIQSEQFPKEETTEIEDGRAKQKMAWKSVQQHRHNSFFVSLQAS